MTKKTKTILVVVILFLALGIIFFPSIKNIFVDENISSTQNPQNPSAEKRKPLNVNAKIIQFENLDDAFLTIGSTLPDEEVDLSFETSGKIVKIYFQEGTNIKKGQLLAKVNDEPLQAELKKLQAQLPLAKDRVFRQKSLLEKDAVSQEAYEQVTTELAKLEADIDLVESRIAQTELKAPFDGIIGLRFVSEGQYASPTTIIAKLTKITPLKIEFSINERQANEIKEGTNLKFSLQDNPEIYNAKVYAVESKIDTKTRTLTARAIYPNPNGKLKPGRSVSINIKLNEIVNAITAPSEAVIAEMGRDIAYVYRNGKAEQVELIKGLRTESKVQIIQGLKVGDTLITSGVMQLRNEMPVNIEIK